MPDRLSRIDLNLLVALHALIQERNVTRAAARLCVTTSAMSKTLNRLKDVLNDPLFERGQSGLILTRRVEELAKPLARMLGEIDDIMFADMRDFAGYEGTIHIAIPEVFSAPIISRLLQSLSAKAPKLRLATRNVDDDYLDRLFDGQLDYILYQEESTSGLISLPMGWHYPVLTMRAGHPLTAMETIDACDFFAYPHIVYNIPKARYHEFDPYYRQLKSSEKVVWETTQLFSAIEVLLTTDSVMIGSEIFVSTRLCGAKLVSRPLACVPGFDTVAAQMHLTFHERQESASLHKWFVEQLAPVCADVLPRRLFQADSGTAEQNMPLVIC